MKSSKQSLDIQGVLSVPSEIRWIGDIMILPASPNPFKGSNNSNRNHVPRAKR